jgi:hypothetical protein
MGLLSYKNMLDTFVQTWGLKNKQLAALLAEKSCQALAAVYPPVPER